MLRCGSQIWVCRVVHAVRFRLAVLRGPLHHLKKERRIASFQGRGREDAGELIATFCCDGRLQSLEEWSATVPARAREVGLTMKLANRNTKRSWAWLSGVFDSFWPGREGPDCL